MSITFEDGGSTTESEDNSFYQELCVKSEPAAYGSDAPKVSHIAEIVESKAQVVKLEGDVVEPHRDNASNSSKRLEVTPLDITMPPCCSACGYALLVVPQHKLLNSTNMMDCKCCLLMLPESSYSKTQRSESRIAIRKCKSCTGNGTRDAVRLVKPTRERPRAPPRLRTAEAEKRQKEASAIFENKVARLKMAKRALLRKRTEVAKLKATKRREEYEQQLNREEKEIQLQSVQLKRQNPFAFCSLMKELKIKKPRVGDNGLVKRKTSTSKRMRPKRNSDGDSNQARKKKKGLEVDLSIYRPPASLTEVAPARVISTRLTARVQLKEVAAHECDKTMSSQKPKTE